MLTIANDGSILTYARRNTVSVVDFEKGTTHDLTLPLVSRALAFVDQVWLLGGTAKERELRRVTPAGVPFGEPLLIGDLGPEVTLRPAPIGTPAALLCGRRVVEVHDDCGRLVATPIADARLALPLSPRVWLAMRAGAIWLRRPDRELALQVPPHLVERLVDGGPVYNGSAVALHFAEANEHTVLLIELRGGTLHQRLRLESPALMRVVCRRGHAVLLQDERRFTILDLRFGRVLHEWRHHRRVADFVVDSDGKHLVILPYQERGDETVMPQVAAYSDLCSRAPSGTATAAAREPGVEAAPAHDEGPPTPEVRLPARSLAPAAPTLIRDGEQARREVEALLARPLLALSPRPVASVDDAAQLSALDLELRRVAAWCKQAIAIGWDTGRLSPPQPMELPFEAEVSAILEATRGRAGERRARAARHVAETEELQRTRRAGVSPCERLAAEFELSELASEILLVAAAPGLWGELARPYAIIANDVGRPLCDELLVAQILGHRRPRRAIARELDADGRLRRHGLLQLGAGARPFAALTVPDVVLQRLWGTSFEPTAENDSSCPADCALLDLRMPVEVLASLLRSLGQSTLNGSLRLVVRGRAGSGRRTLVRALATHAGRSLGIVEVAQLVGRDRALPEALRAELRAVVLRGCLPCVSGVELLVAELPPIRERIAEVFRVHPGPVVFRCLLGVTPPLDPGYLAVDLPPLTEGERVTAWSHSLSVHRLPVELAEPLASRYTIEAGSIEQIARQVDGTSGADPLARLEAAVRQHRETRIGATAVRVARLASWSSVVLPPEIVDSLREFIGRVQHRRTVYERWGFEKLVTSGRGLTALFQGGPGTGKSMVAGIIARELGYELYRIDLGRVLSKWIGETEKNLGAVFDAAEEGEMVLLFDEADSLFARRTEVKSSIDRYSNVEVNYLLQRIDAFEGIAILTTNFGTSIDSAFMRRLSLRLTFPFPDEELRERLWSVHLPADLPIAGELDLKSLAQKYQLSGGYIRNAVLRAAFLAAQEDRPVSHDHLERAVKLEYRETGKLLAGGVLE